MTYHHGLMQAILYDKVRGWATNIYCNLQKMHSERHTHTHREREKVRDREAER
jgi:hypothetical protein